METTSIMDEKTVRMPRVYGVYTELQAPSPNENSKALFSLSPETLDCIAREVQDIFCSSNFARTKVFSISETFSNTKNIISLRGDDDRIQYQWTKPVFLSSQSKTFQNRLPMRKQISWRPWILGTWLRSDEIVNSGGYISYLLSVDIASSLRRRWRR